MDTAKIKELLLAHDFDHLVGVREDEQLECKSQPYDLMQDFNKRELAKDVCALANVDGGLILIGARTKKGQFHSGDEIERLRPFEQNLLNPDQYHKVLDDWIYPPVKDVGIRFYEGTTLNKGVFIIEVPKQNQNAKPFLIKRILDPQKTVEILFGYVERKRDGNKPLTIADLQTILRKGFLYEKSIERQFIVESFPAFRNENWKTKQILIDRPNFWQFLIAEELLRTRFKEIRLLSTDLARGAVLRKHRSVGGQEFWDWFGLKWPEAQGAAEMISGCINNELPDAWRQCSDPMADPTPIFSAIERLYTACKFLIDWETDVFTIHPPDSLEPLRAVTFGTTQEFIDELETLPNHLAEAVQKGQSHTGTTPIVHKIALDLRFTRQKLILETMEQLKGHFVP